MGLIEANDLVRWADRYDSSAELPNLLKRLVLASASSIENIKVNFTSGKSIARPGWDGYVLVENPESRFLPSGPSVWEVSTETDVVGKAKSDFDSRLDLASTPLPDGFKREETTYVAVTLREWPVKCHKKNLRDAVLTDFKNRKFWNDVKIIAANDLVDWIDEKFAVKSWLLKDVLGRRGPTPVHVDKAWSDWKAGCKFPINPEMLLLDRDETSKEVTARFVHGDDITVIKADSQDEAQAFLIANFLALPDGDFIRDYFVSRALVVSHEASAEELEVGYGSSILILKNGAVGSAGILSEKGHQIFIPVGKSTPDTPDQIILTPQSRHAFVKGLESSGIKPSDAQLYARKCGGNLPAFRRRFPKGISKTPGWVAERGGIQDLVPAILAGSWDESIKADKAVLKLLAGRPYNKYRNNLPFFLSVDDSPLRKTGHIFSLNVSSDAFSLAKPFLTPDSFNRFADSVKRVFSELDPLYNIAPANQFVARFKGARRGYSDSIRGGLAETLIMISSSEGPFDGAGVLSGEAFVENLTRGLLAPDPKTSIIGCLNGQLPTFMEAAPGPFFDALERMLRETPDAVREFFNDNDDASIYWGSNSPHTYLLWGLETLAWNPEFLPRVAIILAGLAFADHGGRLANRPLNSLREIFLPWKPGTNTPVTARQQVIDRICERYPDIGWKLCVSLLPYHHDCSFSTAEPKWHDYGPMEKEAVPDHLVSAQHNFFLERAVSLAGADPEKWAEILRTLRHYPSDERGGVVTALRKAVSLVSDGRVKYNFWETIREFVTRESSFKDDHWSLRGAVLDELRGIDEEIAPKDPLLMYRWLFVEPLPDIGSQRKYSDEYNTELSEKRFHAFKDIYRSSGADGILELAREISHQGLLARPWIEIAKTPAAILEIIGVLAPESPRFQHLISCVSGIAFSKFRSVWTDSIRGLAEKGCFPKEVFVHCALGWPDDDDTFAFVASLGEDTERKYWEIRPAWTQAKDPQGFVFILEHLLDVNRGLDALNLVVNSHREVYFETRHLLRLLNLTTLSLTTGKARPLDTMTGYGIKEIFEVLRQRTDVDRSEIAIAEYALLPLLTEPWEGERLILHEMLSEDPGFFVQIICDVYKPASKDKGLIVDENGRLRAQYGYTLLESWKTTPGINKEGVIQESELKRWITTARELAAENDRVDITDQEIGRVLAYSPNDPEDGVWPHRLVRNILESFGNQHIKIGLTIEIYNKRGVVTREVFEGGKQERGLAEQWRGWASTVRSQWPYTGSVLSAIAEGWERDAERADIDADQDRIRFRE